MAVNKNQITNFKMGRGTIGEFSFAAWDFVSDCKGGECDLFKVCEYAKEYVSAGIEKQRRKCGVEAYYIRRVSHPFFEIVQNLKDPFIMQWVGFHIVPLYHHLVKFKKVERSLENPMMMTVRGDSVIHPVYREIRNTIAAIRKEWKNSGLMQIAKDEGYLGRLPSPLAGDDDDPIDGDPDYHDTLYDEKDYTEESDEPEYTEESDEPE